MKPTKEQAFHEFMMVIGRYYASLKDDVSNPPALPVVDPGVSTPQEDREEFNALADEAQAMIGTVLRNTEMDYDEQGRPEDGLNRIRHFRQYLTAYEDDDADVMAMGLAVALEMIKEGIK